MHTITILQGHSVNKQTSLRASRLFEDGLLNIGSNLEEARNSGSLFHTNCIPVEKIEIYNKKSHGMV